MSFKRHTEHYFETAEHSFPIPWEFLDGSELLKISDDGLKAVLGSLTYDEDAEDPFDRDEGDFYQFDPHYIHHTARPEIEEFKRIIRANPGRVFTTSWSGDHHGPGTTRIRIEAGPFSVADTKDDKTMKTPRECKAGLALEKAGGYYIAPEDATDPAACAKGALETYSSWCNGDVYGVCVWLYERENIKDPWSEPDRDQECWGFIGYEYAREELQQQFDGEEV